MIISKPLFSLLIVALLGGCATAMPKRDCPSFYHFEAAQWYPGTKGTLYTYASDSGEELNYVLTSIESNQPYTLLNLAGKTVLDVQCTLSRKLKVHSADASHGFEFNFSQSDYIGVPMQEQRLLLFVKPFSPHALDLPLRFSMDLEAQRMHHTERLATTQAIPRAYFSSHVIDGKEYKNVIEVHRSTAIKAKHINAPAEVAIKRMVFAKGYGLIQFERDDGQIFNLKSG